MTCFGTAENFTFITLLPDMQKSVEPKRFEKYLWCECSSENANHCSKIQLESGFSIDHCNENLSLWGVQVIHSHEKLTILSIGSESTACCFSFSLIIYNIKFGITAQPIIVAFIKMKFI